MSFKQKVPTDTAIIRYRFEHERRLRIELFTPARRHFCSVHLPGDFPKQVRAFNHAINGIERQDFIRHGYGLFQVLVAPVFKHFKRYAKLVIIPDGCLKRLPFEALLQRQVASNSSYRKLPYLIRSFDIAYISPRFMNTSKGAAPKMSSARNGFLGVAPIFTSCPNAIQQHTLEVGAQTLRDFPTTASSLNMLTYSEQEVKRVNKTFEKNGFPTQTLLYSEATVENFCANARGKKFILLSAHHILNSRHPENCGIVLNPNWSAPERLSILSGEMAFTLKVDADLVVLNCCETGVELREISCASQNLTGAFLQSGTSNVISTLTKVYDKASGELVQRLFRYILDGSSYARALRQAKLRFIEDVTSCPKLWSGFVLNQGAVHSA